MRMLFCILFCFPSIANGRELFVGYDAAGKARPEICVYVATPGVATKGGIFANLDRVDQTVIDACKQIVTHEALNCVRREASKAMVRDHGSHKGWIFDSRRGVSAEAILG
jgi:hypothetical protein